MRSKTCSHAFRILCIHFACASICQAVAGEVEQFPDTSASGATTSPMLARENLASPVSRPMLMKDEDCIDDIPDNGSAALGGEKLKLFSAARLSSPDKPPSSATVKTAGSQSAGEQNTRSSEPSLALKKQGPLDWESTPAAAPQSPLARPASQSVAMEWEITPADHTLNAAISRWATAAGWQLVWELPIDYTIETRSAISGSFEEAVETIAKSMTSAEMPIKAIFYAQNKVLRIVANGAQQ